MFFKNVDIVMSEFGSERIPRSLLRVSERILNYIIP